MKIVFTGAGGGHFYPLIAVAEAVTKNTTTHNTERPSLYFFSDKPYDEKALTENSINFVETPAGKLRLYASVDNISDIFKTMYGCIVAIIKLFSIYPDVIFAKGGYASFPTLVAARILSIPVVIHESDTVPGRTTLWAGKFALRVAVSYEEASTSYDTSKTALTGQPIRDSLLPPQDYQKSESLRERPLILILGGSQGSVRLNTVTMEVLRDLLNTYDIIHQAGEANASSIKSMVAEALKDHPFKEHYFVEGFIDVSLFYPKADLVITRAGSALFEVALWQIPMIIVPIPESISRDQKSNAYAMNRKGVASVIEEENLGHTLLLSEIERIMTNSEIYSRMSKAGKQFETSRNASHTIANELIAIASSHQ